MVGVNGRPVRNASDLRNRVGLLRIGDKVTLEVLRRACSARTGASRSAPRSRPRSTRWRAARRSDPRLEGARFGDIPERAPADGEVEGVMVCEVKRGGRAWQNGLRRGTSCYR